MKKRNIIAMIIAIIILVVLFLSIDSFLKIRSTQTTSGEISNFEECIVAGNPAMESYPRKCRDSKTENTFTEVIDDAWRLDGVILMQNTETGDIECFGCNEARDGEPALCKDPALGVEQIPETSEKYCSNDFQVIGESNGAVCGNEICEEGEADIEGGCGPDADPRCLGPPSYEGTCSEDC